MVIFMNIGCKASVVTLVTNENTAIKAKSGSLPVFGTPCLVALMENASCVCVAPFLSDGDTTVGTRMDVRHTAPTPIGLQVTAEAELIEQDGRTLRFKVTAHDDSGEVGSGIHERVIVHAEPFIEKANKKCPSQNFDVTV